MLKEQIKEKRTRNNLETLDGLIRGQQRNVEEFLIEDNEVLVSEDLLSVFPNKADITKFVTKVNVNNGNGKYPHLKVENAELTSVDELLEDAEIPEVNVVNLDYTIKTFRGEIPISVEVIEDTEINLGEALAKQAKQIDINTKNTEIIKLLKTATAQTVTGEAELISLINGYPTAFDIKLFISLSLYDLLDNKNLIDYAKEYPRFKGKEIVKIDDTKIGETAGDLVGFVGDAYNFIHLFDRKLVSFKYAKDRLYSRPIKIATRFDCQVANTEAGNYITFVEAV